MRTYPRNSPEAAARIVALVLIADGHVCRSEFEVFDQLQGPRELGLAPGALPRIVQSLCEDLLMGDPGSGSMLGGLDDDALAALMAEVDDPALQARVLRLAMAAASADRHLADGEAVVLAAARRHWGLPDEAAQAHHPAATPLAA
ncbi:MAG: TerB family tellurite resistance protein [Burkholderiales bacterium]|nr:TerB family tellurite resistance protein [Burkholderiales bacterium]